MSKAKKIISMLLAILMVMSVAPASVIASAVEPSATFRAPDTEIVTYSTDTSGTSEVVRVAGGAGLFTLGTTVVAATPSGIPKSDSGTYIDIAYDGETPEFPLVSFKIKGTRPTQNPTIASNLGSNVTLTSEAVGTLQSDGSYLYTWRMTAGTANQGDVITYTITYYVDGVKEAQKAYAYSYVENILVMNGYVAFKRLDSHDHHPATCHSNIVQVGGRNMYPGWTAGTNSLDRGFVNFGSGGVYGGGSLKGAGSEDAMASEADGYVVSSNATNLTGTPCPAVVKTSYNQSGDASTVNVMFGVNGNRGESTLYIDKRNETLESLNVRVTLQAGEAGDGSDHGSGETGGDDSYPWPGTNLGGIEVLNGQIDFAVGDSWNTVKSKATSLISIGEISVSSNRTSIPDNDNYGHIVSHFSGTGPALQNGTTKYQNTLLVYAWETDTNGKGSSTNYETGAIGLTFVVYNTIDLYNVFYGIMAGQNINNGSNSYTCTDYIKYVANQGETPATSSNLTINFNKGAHPQPSQYTIGWDNFLTAYQNAGMILSKPDTNQTAINNATVALINAYNGLGGFNQNVNYTIKHVLAGGSQTEIVNATTEGYTAAAQTGTVAAGTKLTAYAATIPGYTVAGNSVNEVTLTGKNANETITFEYNPVNVNVNADTNNENLEKYLIDGKEVNRVIQYHPVPYKGSFDVSNATTGDGTTDRPGVGTKNGWEFVAWYRAEPADGVSWDESQRITSPIQMTTLNPVSIYARWDTAPIHMYAKAMTDTGTVINGGNEIDLGFVKPPASGDAIDFNRPAASVMTLEGYEFVGFYESYNNGFQNAVEFPVKFALGDSDKHIVARYADVNNKIIFEPNGGSACPDFTYTVGTPFTAADLPVPTKVGYSFEGWYKDVELSTPLFTEQAPSVTMQTSTGFVVYAAWKAKPLTVKFDTALGASTTKYDTKTISDRVGVVKEVLPKDDVPANPRRFGYSFEGWLYNGRPFDFSQPLPVADDEITLVATWSKTDDSAFIELNAIKKSLGQEIYLDSDDSKTDDDIVQHGDLITVRMTSKTNFSVGSSLFIFMYDADFYELQGSGKDAFTLNYDDSYIGGINAKYSAVTNSSSLPWPSGADSTTYNAIQIAIDPTVAADNFNCEPMDGKTWMVEFKLKVKDTAEGEGTIYMDNAWTRTPDNIMGTMFYGWAKDSTVSVIETENNKVTPDLADATRTLKIDTEEPVKTTVNLDANGGAWADNDTTKTFANGNAGSEIAGYTRPERVGYTLGENAWYAVKDDTTSAQWIEGYYPPEDTLTATYYANWTPNSYPVVFHWEQGSDEIYTEISVPYETQIAADAVTAPSKQGYTFAGWTDTDGSLVTLPTQMNVADENGYHLYATWTPATDTKFTIRVNYTLQNTGADAFMNQQKDKANAAFQGTTGQRVALVETVPENADPNTLYITVDQLALVQQGNYIYKASLNTPDEFGHIDTETIAGDGSTVLEVWFEAKMLTLTFNANGGTFADGKDILTKSGKFLTAFGGLADSELPTRQGYDFAGWKTSATTNTTATVTTSFNREITYYAHWTAKKAHVRFMLSETEQYGTLIEVEVGKAPATPAEPTKAGWTFLGWNTDPDATTGVKTIPVVNEVDSADGYAITYYAIYTKTPFTVVYNVTDPVTGAVEQIGETETYFMDDVVTVKGTDGADLVKKGYTFNGWTYNGEAVGATFEMPDANIEINGTYTAKTIKVKFYADEGAYAGGEAYIEVDSTFNEAINVPAEAQNPSKAGYDFAGWAAAADAETGSTSLGTLTEEAASFYAVYAPQKHTYYIDVYEMGLDGQYPDDPTRTETAEGYVDDTVEITSADNVTGFTLATPATQSGVVPATGDLRFTVKYERNEYTINYIVEGAETPVKYYFGATIDAANEPAKVKKGHSFTAWSPALPATMPAGDLETTAQFNANSYTVTYKDGDAVIGTATVVYDNDIPSKPADASNPSKTGYTFLGYAYEGTTDVVVSTTSTVKISDSDVTLVAVWNVNEYRLNYIGASGVHEYFMVDYGTPAAEWPVPAENPVKTGSYFNGWKESTYATMPTEVVNIQADWVVETYKFQFNNTGDTTYGEDNIVTVTYGEAFDGVEDPEWAGYVFLGWDDEIPANIEDLGEDGEIVKVFTASWREEKYVLHFANTGDTTIADKNVKFGDTIAATADPEWAGHVFAGWDVTPPTVIGDLGNDGATITYTAKWTKETYILHFANTGDTVIDDKNVTFGDTIAATPDPVKKGYKFASWDVTPPTTIGDLGDNGATITYTASWTIDQFTITFDSDEGTAVAPITEDYMTVIEAPTAPTKTGNVFSHWINTKDNSTVTFPIEMPAENLNLKAIWTVEAYTIKFADTDDAGTVITKDVIFGDTITVPSGLVKTGYVFDGWKDADGNDATPPTAIGDLGENGAVITYTAKWREKTYTLKFVDTGDVTIADKNVKFGDTIEVPTDLTKEGQGYYFTGAWKDANGNAATPPATINDMGADGAEFTYVAQWAKETYTIAFDSNGGSTVESIVKQYGDMVTVPANPTKTGHGFVQWNDAEGNKYDIQLIMPDLGENNTTITLTAQWQKNVYTVNFYDAYGEIFTTASIEYDADIADYVPATLPEKEHYITLGWSTVQGDNVAITDFGKMPANDKLAYYPVLERVKVTLALKEGTTAEAFEIDETNPDLKVGYIRGLDTQLTKAALESTYLGVTGDGALRITPSWNAFNICGTGTMVEVIDNVENEVVEVYYIVIYGDVNGDSAVSATDIPAINKEVLGATAWSIEGDAEYSKAKVLAADLRDDGEDAVVNGLDATLIRDVTLSVAYIDQTTGEVIYY